MERISKSSLIYYKCEKCIKDDEENWEMDDWDLDSFEWTGNINFR